MSRHSFTLIELLIVLVVIGILTALAIPQYDRYIINSQAAETRQVLNSVANAAWNYVLENGKFPAFPFGINNLDVTFPKSKYFTYRYDFDNTQCFIYAWSNQSVSHYIPPSPLNPNGAVILLYGIVYSQTLPGTGDNAQKMDDTWYKYYVKGTRPASGIVIPEYYSYLINNSNGRPGQAWN